MNKTDINMILKLFQFYSKHENISKQQNPNRVHSSNNVCKVFLLEMAYVLILRVFFKTGSFITVLTDYKKIKISNHIYVINKYKMRSVLSQRSQRSNVNMQNIRGKIATLKLQQALQKGKTVDNFKFKGSCLHENNLRIVINKEQEILNKRKQQLMKSKIHYVNKKVDCCSNNSDHIIKKQSDRVLNFLRTHSSKDIYRQMRNTQQKIPEISNDQDLNDGRLTKQQQRQIQQQLRRFTPLRPNSRHSKLQDAVSSSSRSHRLRTLSKKSSFARFQQNQNPQVSKKQKYLRKGSRVRQLLLRQLNIPVSPDEQQLAYLKDYDQWVPISFVSLKKQELQKLMEIYMGGKKKEEEDKWKVNGKYPMFYL